MSIAVDLEDRCTEALERALSSAPFYARWRLLDPGRSRRVRERLAAFPILTKKDLRAHVPQGFMYEDAAAEFAAGNAEIVTTSGTADERLSVVWH